MMIRQTKLFHRDHSAIVGIMGPAKAPAKLLRSVEQLGGALAQEGWTVLTGGRNQGVMEAALKGAKEAQGQTIGILPGTREESDISSYVDIPIFTGMGEARNVINIHTSEVIIACGSGAGTSSEISLALKTKTPTILFQCPDFAAEYFQHLADQVKAPFFKVTDQRDQVIHHCHEILS
ncbi:MAG: cytochrome [Bacteroidota bacterium]